MNKAKRYEQFTRYDDWFIEQLDKRLARYRKNKN